MQPFTQPDGVIGFAGTSAERALIGTVGNSYTAKNGTPFFETDTGLLYYYYGSSWYRKDGVNVIGSVYGSPANTLLTASASATASTGTLVTSNDVSMYNYHAVELATLGATSITVQGSIDGTNYSAIRMHDASTGALYAATAITDAGRIYFTREKYRNIRVIITGSGSTTVRYVHGWV